MVKTASIIALLLLAIVLVTAHPDVKMPQEDDEINDAFTDFEQKYNKEYESDENRVHRQGVFRANLKKIDELNANDPTGKYGITEYADLTDEEVHKKLHSVFPEEDEITDFSHMDTAREPDFDFENDEDWEHEESWDWRKKDAVAHVKNQLHCGACWAFSILGNLEGMMKLRGHKLTSLSEQNLLDCDRAQHGCHGGVPAKGYHWIINHLGVDMEKNYRYFGRRKMCRFKQRGPTVRVPLSGWTHLPKNEDKIAKYLQKHGPLAIALHGRGWLHFYHGGIAQPPHCPMKITHGVVLVGYGVENGMKYWILKNSWGPLFGEKGFFRLLRGKNLCNLTHLVNSAVFKSPVKDGYVSDMFVSDDDDEDQESDADEYGEDGSEWE